MRTGPNKAFIQYIGSLKGLFREHEGECVQEIRFRMHPSAKDFIESQGVPHVEIFALRVNGSFKPLEYNVRPGDYLVVYPQSHVNGLVDSELLKKADQLPKQFVADVHLGRLARLLRLLGIDVAHSTQMDDTRIIEIAIQENRAVLSRDLGLLKHGTLKFGYWPRSDDPEEQVMEVIEYFNLKSSLRPFSRCLECNGQLHQVEFELISERVPEKVKQWNDEYVKCGQCDKIYWKGSHYERLKKTVDKILDRLE